MFKRKKPSLGIEIGNATIKLALLSAGKKQKLEFWSQIPVPEAAVMANTIIDPEAIGLAIRGELGIFDDDATTTIAVGGQAVSLRLLKLPPLQKGELAQAVEYESRNVLPFPLETTYWDYEVIAQHEQTEVLVAAAEQEFVDQYIEALALARIVPQAVEPGSMALGRSLAEQLADDSCAVLNLDTYTQELTIYSSGVPVFFRLLPGAGEDLTVTAGGELMPAQVELVQELRRSFDYYSRERGAAVEKLLVVGTDEADLIATLQSQLAIEVSLGDPTARIILLPEDELIFPKAQFATALGLALRGVWDE